MNLNLQKLRSDYGIEQHLFAQILNCSVGELALMEEGKKEIPLTYAPVLAMFVFPEEIENEDIRNLLNSCRRPICKMQKNDSANKSSDTADTKENESGIKMTAAAKSKYPEISKLSEDITGQFMLASELLSPKKNDEVSISESESKNGLGKELTFAENSAHEAEPNEAGHYIIYTDGGCDHNPGGRGGYGAVVINEETGEYRELSGGYLATTNNRMEVMAAIKAIETVSIGSSITLISDSQYLVKTLEGEYSRKKNRDLWKMLDEAMEGKEVAAQWIRGHKGNENNEKCDRLATIAMTGELIADEGYVPGNSQKEPAVTPNCEKVSAMTIKISLPQLGEDREMAQIVAAEQYAEEHQVSIACAKSMYAFWENDKPGFKSYMNLKTGGADFWSSVTEEDLLSALEYDKTHYEEIKSYFSSRKDILSCLRWNARGLGLSDAIRKVLVDIELSANCNKKR